jgi:hypothetical protein
MHTNNYVCNFKKSQPYNCMFSIHLHNSNLQSSLINVDIGIKCDQDVACQWWTHNLQDFPLNTINNCQLHCFDKKHNILHQMAPTTCVVVVAPTTIVMNNTSSNLNSLHLHLLFQFIWKPNVQVIQEIQENGMYNFEFF